MRCIGNKNKTLSEKQYDRTPLLGYSLEAELPENILEHGRRNNGMFKNDVHKLAYKLCNVNYIEIKTNYTHVMVLYVYAT